MYKQRLAIPVPKRISTPFLAFSTSSEQFQGLWAVPAEFAAQFGANLACKLCNRRTETRRLMDPESPASVHLM